MSGEKRREMNKAKIRGVFRVKKIVKKLKAAWSKNGR